MACICPHDLKACPDDLCLGSGTCSVNGWGLLEQCASCGQTYSRDDGIDCACDSDDPFDTDECDHGMPFSEVCDDCEDEAVDDDEE